MAHYKILVIDYEPRGVAQLRDPLQAAGYLVSVAHDGVAGMKLFEEIEPDLTLIEAMLPKKHGFEVCRDLKQTPHGARSPVVIVTSVYRGRKYRTQAFHSYNCDEFLEKPISSATLLSTVERLLEDRVMAPVKPVEAAPLATEAAPKPAPKPDPVPEAESAPSDQSAAAVSSPEDDVESEISERLDELLGGGSDPGPQASAARVPNGANVLPFDRARGRESAAGHDAAGVPGGSHTPIAASGAAGAQAAQPELSYQPVRDLRPRTARKPWPEYRECDARLEPAPLSADRRGRWLLLATFVVAAAASSAAFLILNWPF